LQEDKGEIALVVPYLAPDLGCGKTQDFVSLCKRILLFFSGVLNKRNIHDEVLSRLCNLAFYPMNDLAKSSCQ